MGLEIEPIYSAEQIVVPPDFASVLKAYTKEVIRRQPSDLLDFSAAYFANLANVTPHLAFVPPSYDQLSEVSRGFGNATSITVEDLLEACTAAGIASESVQKVMSVGSIEGDTVDPYDVILLLLSAIEENLASVLMALFDVLGVNGKIPKPLFLRSLHHVMKRDPSIPSSAVSAITTELSLYNDENTLGYEDVLGSSTLKDIIGRLESRD